MNIKYCLRNVTTIFLLFLLSCKKLVEVEAPINQLVTETVFKDSADATAAVVGMYTSMMQFSTTVNFASGAITIYSGLAGDELQTTSTNAAVMNFHANAVSPENSLNYDLWRYAYEIIYQANACIEGLSASESLKTSVKNQLLGEAKIIRAFFYFNLVNLYGGVPLVTTINYKKNAVMPRNSIDEVYEQIVRDLKDAESTLSSGYVTSGRLRPNRFTANAFLARVYLFQKQWVNAELEATKVINAGIYNLETDLSNVFLKTSKESIWQMPPLQSPLGLAECRQFVPLGTAIPVYPITEFLRNSFENSDQRKLKWLSTRISNGFTYYIPFKYKLRTSSTADEHYIILRLAEQYLIRAEAKTYQNDLGNAIADINTIRRRAGLTDTTASSQLNILSLIAHERHIELFCEWGHRWYDLKRTETISSVLAINKPAWQSTDALFPIPFNEIQLNPYLIQNPGY
ncbi:MAG: RagB/SusD family nutrient uptake outer membrane protein [Chitinophagaceae bacterium]|nr:RagB/SusD family nutrient uptake outer membrane protein [Chitinophagaceae bacterium]